MQADYNAREQKMRFATEFQFPPPPLFEFPDRPNRNAEKLGQAYLQGLRSELPERACRPRRFEVRKRTDISNRRKLAFQLMSVYASSSGLLTRDSAKFRHIEAIDLAISDRLLLHVNNPKLLKIPSKPKYFGYYSDNALNNRGRRQVNQSSYSQSPSVRSGVSTGHLSPRLINIDQCFCFQGRFTDAPNQSKSCTVKSVKGPRCSFGEYPRPITVREHRRARAVTRMPVIEEIEKLSSAEEEEKIQSGAGEARSYEFANINKSIMPNQSKDQEVSSGSLLDMMHKQFCPNQYNKSHSQGACLKPSLPVSIQYPKSPRSSPISLHTFPDAIAIAAHNHNKLKLPLAAFRSISLMAGKNIGRNLSPILSSSFSFSSCPSTPVSPSSVHSLESPLLSPGSWFDEDVFSPSRTNSWQRANDLWNEELVVTTQQNSCYEDQHLNAIKMEDDSPSTPTESEVEAVEACEWLREAGFPQYAQMYKDNQFPIEDMKAAERDHEFLDEDALQALFRRLDVLNKCSSSKLKRSPVKKNIYDSDDEEDCALSNKWTFQRNSRSWSRKEADVIPYLISQPDASIHFTSSRDSVFDGAVEKASPVSISGSPSFVLPSEEENHSAATLLFSNTMNNPTTLNQNLSHSDTGEIPRAVKLKRPNLFLSPFSSGVENPAEFTSREEVGSLNNGNKDVFHSANNLKPTASTSRHDFPIISRHLSDSENPPPSPNSTSLDLQRATSDKFWGALGIFRRIEGFRVRRSVRKSSKSELTKKDIGNPVLVESPEVLMKIESLQCTDISPASENVKDFGQFVIGTQNSGDPLEPKTPSNERQNLQPLSMDSANIPHIAERHSICDGKTPHEQIRLVKGCDQAKSSHNSGSTVGSDSKLPPVSDINRHSRSLDGESQNLEDAVDIISELLQSVTSELSTSTNNRKRMSIYDNVSSEVCSAMQNELDALLSDLYKNIDSLDYSMSKVAADLRVESPTSSVGTFDDEDTTKTPAAVQPKKNLVAEDSFGGCDSTDGNTSTTPSEGSYHLDCTAAKLDSAIHRFVKDASAVENLSEDPFQPVEASKRVQLCTESDPDSEDSVEQTVDDWSYPNRGGVRERRDSGVGSSLTRTASSKRQKRARLRWHSFAKSHQTTLNSYDQPISNLSAGQLAVLRKLSLLKVTAALEKYSPANRANWSWFVPRLRRRSKMPDYSERNVFGIPIAVTQQRHGQPLPQCILYAMRRLRRSANDSVGIFRKSGVRMRVQALRIALESDPDAIDFDGVHAYDVADLLKLYFRELPECLLTNKLSNVFISIFLYMPLDLRRDLIRLTLLLLPDEHRLTLQSLLLFLNDMAQHSQLNQMNASNLAVCFAPSLFYLCGAKTSSASSPKQMQKRAPVPSEKDVIEQKVAHECLTYMITNAKTIFTVSEEMLKMCPLSYLEQGSPVPLEDLCRNYGKCDGGNYSTYVDSCIQGVLKESREKFKGWISHPAHRGDVDLTYKKVGDGHPLRLWKFCIEVEAPPEEVLNRVLKERHLWDDDVLKWRVVEKLDSQTEVFQYVLNSMVPHPTRDFSELRSWRTNLSRGMCILISTSVEHANAPLMGDVRGVVLASRYLIEPCGSGKSRLTHIIRIDLRGHSPDWYNSVYGHICANYARRIRDSFKSSIDLTAGPETKV